MLRVIATGEFSLEEAERTFLEMLDAIARHKAEKILLDGRALKGDPGTIQRFLYGEFAAHAVERYIRERGVPRASQLIAEARSHIAAVGIADRCELLAGDFFAAVPAGGDAYVLKRVLHDWDDARTIAILQNCYRAMLPKGRTASPGHGGAATAPPLPSRPT